MKLGKHISDLLYPHDEVILSGFGCFTTRYVPARFEKEKGIVEPPARLADFKPEPSEGNSPLPGYIADKESKSVEEVKAFIARVVAEVHRSLKAGKKVELEQLGIFQLDATGGYHFEPNPHVNFLDDASGLPGVPSPVKTPQETGTTDPVAGTTTDQASGQGVSAGQSDSPPASQDQSESTQTHSPETMSEEKEQQTDKLPAALRWLAYAIIPLIIILVILLLNRSFFFGEGGLFRATEEPVARTIPAVVDEVEEEVLPVTEVPDPEPAPEEPLADAKLHPEPGRPVYYLLVGSFRNRTLAGSLVEELREMGASNPEIMGVTPSNYHRVSYGFFYDLAEAEAQKAKLPENLRENAWILHR